MTKFTFGIASGLCFDVLPQKAISFFVCLLYWGSTFRSSATSSKGQRSKQSFRGIHYQPLLFSVFITLLFCYKFMNIAELALTRRGKYSSSFFVILIVFFCSYELLFFFCYLFLTLLYLIMSLNVMLLNYVISYVIKNIYIKPKPPKNFLVVLLLIFFICALSVN